MHGGGEEEEDEEEDSEEVSKEKRWANFNRSKGDEFPFSIQDD